MHALWHHFTETPIASEGEEPEVTCSSFTNTWPILISNDSITIYVPRAFQRAAPRPLTRHYLEAAQHLVSLARNVTMSDIRICGSSFRICKVAFINTLCSPLLFEKFAPTENISDFMLYLCF